MLNIIKTTIEIGLEEPVHILHTTDTHLSLCDERDNERKQALALHRKKCFNDENGSVEKYLEETLEYGKKNCDLIIHTGDLIDFVSEANIDKAAEGINDAIDNVATNFFIKNPLNYKIVKCKNFEKTRYFCIVFSKF